MRSCDLNRLSEANICFQLGALHQQLADAERELNRATANYGRVSDELAAREIELERRRALRAA